MIQEKLNKREFLIKFYNTLYLISVYGLLLNSLWYLIRLFFFDRTPLRGPFNELFHFLVFINLTWSLIAIFKYYKYEIIMDYFVFLLRLMFIIYSSLMVLYFIQITYFDIQPSVSYYWDSGEWTF